MNTEVKIEIDYSKVNSDDITSWYYEVKREQRELDSRIKKMKSEEREMDLKLARLRTDLSKATERYKELDKRAYILNKLDDLFSDDDMEESDG